MSAKLFARAARPRGRPAAALRGPGPCAATGLQRFSRSAFRRATNGAKGGRQEPRIASAWSCSGAFAIAATAGLVGWGASELRHGGFPGTMLLDGGFMAPR